MSRRLDRLTLDNLGDLPQAAQSCVFWELDPVRRSRTRGHEVDEKRLWVSTILRDWGACGRIAYVDDAYAGHLIWGPATHLPGAANFATAPPSPDAVLVASAYVDPARRHTGLARVLVQTMAKDVLKVSRDHKGIKAIEAFGAERPRPSDCVLPVDFWLAVGFGTHRAHPTYPRMRMDLRSLATWREGVENAIEHLRGGVKHPAPQALSRKS